jgi:hypothetical protein
MEKKSKNVNNAKREHIVPQFVKKQIGTQIKDKDTKTGAI